MTLQHPSTRRHIASAPRLFSNSAPAPNSDQLAPNNKHVMQIRKLYKNNDNRRFQTALSLLACTSCFLLTALYYSNRTICPPSNDPPVHLTASVSHSNFAESSHLDIIQTLEQWKNPQYAMSHLRVYVYDLPSRFNSDLVHTSHQSPSHIRDPYCDENFYSSEVHVHHFFLNSSVRTLDPNLANFFYVPIYTTCDLINKQPNDLQRTGRNFRDAMTIVINNYPYWNHTDGRDHVFLFSQGFSARLTGDWTYVKNSIFLVHNGQFTAPEYTPHKDITIPPELRYYFKPIWREKDRRAIVPSEKQYLGQFGGQVVDGRISDHRGSNYSGGVRQFILTFFLGDPDYRITGVRSHTYLSDMKNSKFCLAPEGKSDYFFKLSIITTEYDSVAYLKNCFFFTNCDCLAFIGSGWHPWSPRPYYAVHMGCVPVIISQVQELAFEEFLNWDSLAIWIRPSDIDNLDAILRSIPDSEVISRLQAMNRLWRVLWYEGNDGLAYEAILQSLYNRKMMNRPRRHFVTLNKLRTTSSHSTA